MKNFLIILTTLGFLMSNSVQAQELTKTQRKALKKEIRTYKNYMWERRLMNAMGKDAE